MNNKQVYLNTFYQLIAKFVSAGSAILITILITRNLGAEFYGEYSIVIAYVFMFLIFSDFGINATITKEYAFDESKAKENLSKILTLRIIIGAVVTLIALILLMFFPYSDSIKISILILLPVLILNSLYKTSEIIFMSYHKYKYHALSVSIGSVLMVILFILLLSQGYTGLAVYVLPTLLGYFIITIVSLIFIRSYLKINTSAIDKKYWKYALLDSAPLGVSLLLNTLMVQIDRILLSVLSTPISVGYYSLAYRLFEFILVLPTFYMNSIYAHMVTSKSKSETEYKKIFRSSIRKLGISAVVITVFMFIFAPLAIPIIWGEEMQSVVMPFLILASGTLIFYLSSPLNWKFVAEGKQKYLPYIYGLVLIFNVVMNILLIPRYNYIASAVITIISEFIILVLLILVDNRMSKIENSQLPRN
jgi:O-antigen/teichoic acid export membrane protein